MALGKRTTRQIAEKYKGNLDYYRRPHRFRTVKLVCFALAVAGSLALAIKPHRQEIFSTGPISANHARFANQCEVCHTDLQPGLLQVWKSDRPLQVNAANLLLRVKQDLQPEQMKAGLHATLTASNSLSKLDATCLNCHEPMKLHQPQALSLGLRPVRQEISAAEVASCSTCHREHQGPARMPPPPSSNCTDCHGNSARLQETLVTYKLPGHPPPGVGAVQDFKKDGVRRFVPPRPSPHQPAVFTAFNQGHPAFGYEQPGLRDPAALSFNHARHQQDDIPPVQGRKLACADCHTPGADGVFMQRVKYQQHCSGCHSLHFSSDLPDLTIPHGDPEKVRDALTSAGLTVLMQDYAVHQRKLTDKSQQEAFITEQFRKLNDRGIGTTEALLTRVFRTGDPPQTTNQFFPACAKCHVVSNPPGGATPVVAPTNTADRWLTRGPFNHQPHSHMSCVDCHAQALTSTRTTDILLPPQALCAECHRPLANGKDTVPFQKIESGRVSPQLVAQQRSEGGISNECVYCHPRYHAPAEATAFVKNAVRAK